MFVYFVFSLFRIFYLMCAKTAKTLQEFSKNGVFCRRTYYAEQARRLRGGFLKCPSVRTAHETGPAK